MPRTLGLEIALELEPFELSLLNDVASMARFLDDVDRPAVKANLDISHLALARQPAALVEKLRGRVAHVHISDCDGKVHGDLPPGRGVVDFPPVPASDQSPRYSRRGDLDRAGVFTRARRRSWSGSAEAYEKTAALMREAGLRQ